MVDRQRLLCHEILLSEQPEDSMHVWYALDSFFLFIMTTNNVRYSSEKQLLPCYTMVFWIYTPFLNHY